MISLRHIQICVLVAVAILEECCMASADLQLPFYSSERIVASCVVSLFNYFPNNFCTCSSQDNPFDQYLACLEKQVRIFFFCLSSLISSSFFQHALKK